MRAPPRTLPIGPRGDERPSPPAAPPQGLARTPPELAGEGDRFHDYVLGAYAPLAPHAGKLRSLNLLVESFALAGLEEEGLAVMRRVRDGLGPFRTVWGIKQREGGVLGWELYFYDFERRHADLSIARVAELLAPAVTVDAREPWPLPWHMFSVEIGPAQLRRQEPAAVDVYIDMRSYKLRGDRFAFENVYTFHDPREEIDDILHRLRSSVHFRWGHDPLASLMPPSLLRCGRICVANKIGADALYFSRVPTPALAAFLGARGWPEALRRFVAGHGPALDHLLWDVGIDFDRHEGALRVVKTGLYGSF